jgi:hypothetical protein
MAGEVVFTDMAEARRKALRAAGGAPSPHDVLPSLGEALAGFERPDDPTALPPVSPAEIKAAAMAAVRRLLGMS